MLRGLLALLCSLALCGLALAEEHSRVHPEFSSVEDHWFGKTELRLGLSAAVPYRVYVVADPRRLVVDLQGVGAERLDAGAGRVAALEMQALPDGWARVVGYLSEPMLPEEIAVSQADGHAELVIRLRRASAEDFRARARRADIAPQAGMPAIPGRLDEVTRAGRMVIVIDPGHGGVDPGAVKDGVYEKDLMLRLAEELREALAGDFDVHLTRERDLFVSLPERVNFAHSVGADLFLSLHADAIEEGVARGATVYTLGRDASDAVAARLASAHDRTGIIKGLDLSRTEDGVVGVLSDLARRETDPRSDAFAAVLAQRIAASGAPMHVKPRRHALFSVLQSPDIPSVLLEVGFMSDARDLSNLRDPLWRQGMVSAIREAVTVWRAQEPFPGKEIGQ